MGLFEGKKVRDVMTERPRGIARVSTLREAAEVMALENVGSLPVVEGGSNLVGIVTDRDIVVRAIAKSQDPESMTAGEIMSPDVVTVDPDEDLDAAAELMAFHQIRRLPVVSNDDLVGMLAQADVAGAASEKKTGEVVEDISEPANSPRI